ncbi:AraC family transcriptional regulator [Brucella pituitosa]|uniref:AraC family transcriptional regulator n=1 Tax=Brucella pituitosa TaxID=571256 RepID=UPI000CFED2EE|nr:AraC family transcriptional regulator [Ochrobactrum sp. MYb68]
MAVIALEATHQPPFTEALPEPLFFRTACMPPAARYPMHRHDWGEFVYSFTGVMEVRIGDSHLLAPPQYGIWLPPHIEHQGLNRQEVCYCSLYVTEELCADLPAKACALNLNPLIRTLLEHLRMKKPSQPQRPQETRLLHTLLDQLAIAPCAGSYLPSSTDPALQKILSILEADPSDNRTLHDLAKVANTSERTLMRRCKQELGMSFPEWKQRLRTLKAMPLLEGGAKVEHVALDLGYASASAFIAMFRKLMGITPDEYRRQIGA